MQLSQNIYSQFLKEILQRLVPRSSEALSSLELESLSFASSLVQSATSWRLLHLARYMAAQLIDSRGGLERTALTHLLQIFSEQLYHLGAERAEEAMGMEQILSKLQALGTNAEIDVAIKRIRAPHGHEHALRLIRRSLLLPQTIPVTDALARQAALSAWLVPLRQNVGSCFATAPAILIQASQPLQFFADMGQLFALSALKRTFAGQEYVVPLTAHAGWGSLRFPIEWDSMGEHPAGVLGNSPGLLAAFRAAGLVKEHEKQCTDLLSVFFAKHDMSFATITSEWLIQEILLEHYGVTVEEVEQEKLQLSHLPFLGSGMIHTISTKKSKACSAYIESYQASTEAFISQTEHPLLKAWEFTLASFAEVKSDISRWNLYISLGFQSGEEGGIADVILPLIQGHIDQLNEQIAHFQSMYDHTFAQVKSLEIRMRHVTTEQEAVWLRTEYRVQRKEMERALDMRDEAHDKGRALASVWQIMSAFYLEIFPSYFQEVYDAGMKEVAVGLYDDVPAGFRLLYKYGRSHPSTWTLIYTPQDYVQALCAFFTSTETELLQKASLQKIQAEVSQILTSVVLAIRDPQFLEKSIQRLAKHYGEPIPSPKLQTLHTLKRTPWNYLSGGTMGSLVSTYFARTTPPVEIKRWVETETELLAFYLDTLKELPLGIQERLIKQPDAGLLAYSPTHAFILKPAWSPFMEGWQNQAYTYSWIRDWWVLPQERFWDQLTLEPAHQDYLQQKLMDVLPVGYRSLASQALRSLIGQTTKPSLWREQVAHILSYEKWLKPVYHHVLDVLDQMLVEHLPLYSDTQVGSILSHLWEAMESVDDKMQQKLEMLFREETIALHPLVTPRDIQYIAQGLIMLALDRTSSKVFYIHDLIKSMRALGIVAPSPILFADPNWTDKKFGFAVNPGTGAFELWTWDALGLSGRPLSPWKPYLDGRMRKEWGIYVKPQEYGNGF